MKRVRYEFRRGEDVFRLYFRLEDGFPEVWMSEPSVPRVNGKNISSFFPQRQFLGLQQGTPVRHERL